MGTPQAGCGLEQVGGALWASVWGVSPREGSSSRSRLVFRARARPPGCRSGVTHVLSKGALLAMDAVRPPVSLRREAVGVLSCWGPPGSLTVSWR